MGYALPFVAHLMLPVYTQVNTYSIRIQGGLASNYRLDHSYYTLTGTAHICLDSFPGLTATPLPSPVPQYPIHPLTLALIP
ncbi:hypothetical protein GYMLUDRAFT_638530 [Collybiopsis luxurians FD-317 M1]|nr:hypothetical protein GYMLUDRAFT_638530 [Collybiopsis luxurians FD-317 M1]